MRRSWTRGGRALRFLLTALACLTGIASPAITVLHGVAHAREHAHVLAQRIDHPAGVHLATDGAVARAAIPDAAPSLDAVDQDNDHHPALHTQVVAKPRLDIAAALPVRGPPTLRVVVVAFGASTPVAPSVRAPSAPIPPHTQPRAPPLG